MLVLTRKKNQSIIIGSDIEVKIVEVKGDTVKLGVNAPSSVSVHRKEVYEAIQKENKEAKTFDTNVLEILNSVFKKE